MGAIERFNALGENEATQQLMRCCGSSRWTRAMIAKRPFNSETELSREAQTVWNGLSNADFIEAFSHHPRIGDRVRSGGWESREQSGTASAGQSTLEELKLLNADYEAKFNHVFLICATGKSADEMLAALRMRLKNTAEEELKNAAQEQSLITQLRIKKMLDELSTGTTTGA